MPHGLSTLYQIIAQLELNTNCMRRFGLVIGLMIGLLWNATAQKTITVIASMTGCKGELTMYDFDGATFRPFQTVAGTEGDYRFEVPHTGHKFYYFGPDANNLKPVILGAEEQVLLSQRCASRAPLQVQNSLINQEYYDLKQQFAAINKQNQEAVNTFRRGMRDENLKAEGIALMKVVDEERLRLLDSLKGTNPFLARIAALNTYLSFPNYGQDKYPDELNYFAVEYFQFVDWEDEGYHNLPWVFEAFKTYTNTLSQVNLPQEQYQNLTDQTLAKIPVGSDAERMALNGILAILKQKNNPSFAYFGERYIEHFGDQDPAAAAALREEIDRMGSFVVGGEAPDFTQFTPEGEELSLYDLRGKVVLVDFWASWCGPCRRENPNVVRMYDRFKGQGFEILGVSLDKTKDRWLGAIEQDNLQWLHVSDLKGWSNAVAQMYSVRSIPHTILLDREGRILARGLRGQQLEAKLEELFESRP